MKKTVFLLDIDEYEQEITELTYPLINRWAEKIGAGVFVIKERKFPEWPICCEKMQIYSLAKLYRSDWNIYLDLDTVVHPAFFDPTEHLSKDTVAHFMHDEATVRWSLDNYHRRDGRFIGGGGWMSIASDWCLDLWHPPLPGTRSFLTMNITPTVMEIKAGLKPEHFLDEYIMSRNIARYGLKYIDVYQIMKRLGISDTNWIFHKYALSREQKLERIRTLIEAWGVR